MALATSRHGERYWPSAIGYDSGMRKQIAIVEDEVALRENYGAALARHGYQVKTYANRKSAMQAFDVHLPDLAIIDISLEDEAEGGFDLCRDLRALSAELPIIFLTARDSELDAVSGLRLGADDFLTKDVSLPHCSGASTRCGARTMPPRSCGVAHYRSTATKCRPRGTAFR
jgi:CheY-like chemotaxis protein